uniref:Uncharacterized protein n=2 Tax=Oryza TaxID=4527 RepID=A0A0E0QP75_ORYRU
MEQHQLHLIGTKVVAQRAALEPGGSVAAGGGSGASPTCIKLFLYTMPWRWEPPFLPPSEHEGNAV